MTDHTDIMVTTRQGIYYRPDAKQHMDDTEYCLWWLRQYGWIPETKTARKRHYCHVCLLPILPKQQYYSIVIGGGGLGSLKFPGRIHKNAECLKAYTDKRKENYYGNRSSNSGYG